MIEKINPADALKYLKTEELKIYEEMIAPFAHLDKADSYWQSQLKPVIVLMAALIEERKKGGQV